MTVLLVLVRFLVLIVLDYALNRICVQKQADSNEYDDAEFNDAQSAALEDVAAICAALTALADKAAATLRAFDAKIAAFAAENSTFRG